MNEPLTINLAGSYPVKFGGGLCSTGYKNGLYQDGMAIDTWHSWGDKKMFSGGVMAYKDVLKLKVHIEEWIKLHDQTLTTPTEGQGR